MPSVKFPINVNLESIDGSVDRGKIVNGYAEVASANEVKVYSRPAMDLAQGSFAAFGQGMANTPDGKLFVVSGGNVYFPVPNESFSILSTNTLISGAGYFVSNNQRMFVWDGVSLWAASPPFTAWGTAAAIGNANDLASLISHRGTLVAFYGTTTSVRVSANGNSWSDMTNSPGIVGGMLSDGDTLYVLPASPGLSGRFSSDFGATSWGTLTGTDIPAYTQAPVHFSNRLWVIGTSSSAWSTGGNLWTYGTVTSGITENILFLTAPAVHNGKLYQVTAVGTGGPVNLWASSNGFSFAKVGTLAVPEAISTTGLGQDVIGGELYAAVSNSGTTRTYLYRIDDTGDLTGVTAVGTVDVPVGGMSSIISTESGVSFVKSTTEAYTIEGGVFTKVSDAQYPAVTVRGAVYLNGRLYVMEPDGTIWNSAEDDFTSWAGTDFIVAEFEADGGVCLAKQGEYVIALGQFTTEAFYDAGNPTGSPLDPVGSAVMLIGCAHANSVAQVETSLVWVAQQKGQGSTFHKGRFVAFMKGYGAYDRISTPDVERVLDADAFTEVYADILTIAGHVFYVLTLVDTDITLVYDFRTQLWYQWSLLTQGSAVSVSGITQSSGIATATATAHGFSDGDQVTIAGADQAGYNLTVNVTRVDANTFTYPVAAGTVSPATGTITATGWTEGALDISASCYFDNSQLVQLRETGDVYVLDVTGTSDNGAPIDFRVRTRLWDAGTGREKFQNGLEVQGDKVSSTGLVRYWNEDFTTPTKYKRVDLSLRRPRSKRGGSFSRRAVEFRHTLSAKVGISALEADIELGEQ